MLIRGRSGQRGVAFHVRCRNSQTPAPELSENRAAMRQIPSVVAACSIWRWVLSRLRRRLRRLQTAEAEDPFWAVVR